MAKRGKRPQKTPENSKKKGAEGSTKSSPEGVRTEVREKPLGHCHECEADLRDRDRALFVEEDVGRFFCSEECIVNHFTPEIKSLEEEYFRHLSSDELGTDEREELSSLRWETLEAPEEVWLRRNLAGDFQYTLIREFEHQGKPVWCICVTLFLNGEPSFLYLAFPTRDPNLVEFYRRGEELEVEDGEIPVAGRVVAEVLSTEQATPTAPATDGLADPWTENETIRAHLGQQRSEDDIPFEEFSDYEKLIESALQTPDEVWTNTEKTAKKKMKYFHFIKYYPGEGSGVWYIVIAKEADDVDHIEILDAFPTRDASLVEQYRVGERESSEDVPSTSGSSTRMVH